MKHVMAISVVFFVITVVMGMQLIMGALVAPDKGLGAFGFLLWPAVGTGTAAFVLQAIAIRQHKCASKVETEKD